MTIHSLFGPAVYQTKLPQELFIQLNADCLVASEDMSGILVGQIEKQLGFTPSMLSNDAWFCDTATEFIKEYSKLDMPLQIKEAWYNRTMVPGEYNPQHIHPEALLTSVGYLKVPSNLEEELAKPQPNGVSGGLELFYGETANFARTQARFIPKEGDFFIFPSWLRHAVWPMPDTVTEERRSFSINFMVRQ